MRTADESMRSSVAWVRRARDMKFSRHLFTPLLASTYMGCNAWPNMRGTPSCAGACTCLPLGRTKGHHSWGKPAPSGEQVLWKGDLGGDGGILLTSEYLPRSHGCLILFFFSPSSFKVENLPLSLSPSPPGVSLRQFPRWTAVRDKPDHIEPHGETKQSPRGKQGWSHRPQSLSCIYHLLLPLSLFLFISWFSVSDPHPITHEPTVKSVENPGEDTNKSPLASHPRSLKVFPQISWTLLRGTGPARSAVEEYPLASTYGPWSWYSCPSKWFGLESLCMHILRPSGNRPNRKHRMLVKALLGSLLGHLFFSQRQGSPSHLKCTTGMYLYAVKNPLDYVLRRR